MGGKEKSVAGQRNAGQCRVPHQVGAGEGVGEGNNVILDEAVVPLERHLTWMQGTTAPQCP